MRKLFFVLLPFLLAILQGCSTPPRDPRPDLVYKKVGVISLLDERVPIVRIGLTVFNNRTEYVALPGHVGTIAVDAVASRLRTKRPDLEIVTPSFPVDPTGKLPPPDAFAKIMRDDHLDALFVVTEEWNQYQSLRGIGVYFRALSQTLMDNAFVHANVTVEILGTDGKSVARAGTTRRQSSVTIGVTQLGLTYSLDELAAGSAPAATSSALEAQLAISMASTMSGLGY